MSTFLTVAQVAERLSCSETFVYGLLSSGRLRHYVLGRGQGGKRVSEEQLQDYLQGREKGGQAPPAPAAPKRTPVKLKHLQL